MTPVSFEDWVTIFVYRLPERTEPSGPNRNRLCGSRAAAIIYIYFFFVVIVILAIKT